MQTRTGTWVAMQLHRSRCLISCGPDCQALGTWTDSNVPAGHSTSITGPRCRLLYVRNSSTNPSEGTLQSAPNCKPVSRLSLGSQDFVAWHLWDTGSSGQLQWWQWCQRQLWVSSHTLNLNPAAPQISAIPAIQDAAYHSAAWTRAAR